MKTEKKYKEILAEVVRNEAVSTNKLKMLAEKQKANKLKIEGFLRKAGVIENMGKGVNRVLIRGQNIDPYVDKILKYTKGHYQKVKKNREPLHEPKGLMGAVQENTNKQNEYIAALERRIEKLEKTLQEQRSTTQDQITHIQKQVNDICFELPTLRNQLKAMAESQSSHIVRLDEIIANRTFKNDELTVPLKALQQLLTQIM